MSMRRRGQPALPLARVLPVDLGAAFLDQSIDGFEAVGRLERASQHGVDAEPVQGQGLFESLGQAAGRRLVPLLQLGCNFSSSRLASSYVGRL